MLTSLAYSLLAVVLLWFVWRYVRRGVHRVNDLRAMRQFLEEGLKRGLTEEQMLQELKTTYPKSYEEVVRKDEPKG